MSSVSRNRNLRAIQLAIIAALLIVFLLDLILPLRVAVGVPYVAVILLSLWLPDRRYIFSTAGLVTVLASIGLFFPVSEWPMLNEAILNRAIALFVVWVTAILGNMLVREQETTRLQRDFNESLVETASSIILLLDPEGRIVYFNRNTTDCLGYELGKVTGQDWFETCVAEQDRTRARSHFLQIAQNEIERDSLVSVVAKSGKEFQFSWSFKTMQNATGLITQFLLVGQDVTNLLAAQRRMVAAERLAAIGQTIAAVSHESNNELMALKLGLDMLSATVSEPKSRQLIEHLQNSQTRLHRLLDDVRHFAGPLHLERSICSLRDIWQRAWCSLANIRGDRNAELKEIIPSQDLDTEVDALRLEQVFRNLFENSLAACTDPVWIEIQASQSRQNGQSVLQISVHDNGPGLSPEAKSKVFEPFFTTKQRGTGLGMAISGRILKAHGGDLILANTHKNGAEFVLTLPLDKPTAPVETAT
jgi:two-component system, LuxR family, sensor kinase FixL